MARAHFDDDAREVLGGIQIPLENLEFTIEQHLHMHGDKIDAETERLLKGLRDGISYVAGQTRYIARALPEPVFEQYVARRQVA